MIASLSKSSEPPLSHYSIWNIARHALSDHKKWDPAWRLPDPKKSYDVVIGVAGGHGLATAYFLASQHGVLMLAHSRHDLEANRRWFNSIRMNGIDSTLMSCEDIAELAPWLFDWLENRAKLLGL